MKYAPTTYTSSTAMPHSAMRFIVLRLVDLDGVACGDLEVSPIKASQGMPANGIQRGFTPAPPDLQPARRTRANPGPSHTEGTSGKEFKHWFLQEEVPQLQDQAPKQNHG